MKIRISIYPTNDKNVFDRTLYVLSGYLVPINSNTKQLSSREGLYRVDFLYTENFDFMTLQYGSVCKSYSSSI